MTDKKPLGVMFWHRKLSADTLRPRDVVEVALDAAGMKHRELAESQFIGRALQHTKKDGMKITRIPKKYQANTDETQYQISDVFFDGYWLKQEGRDMITYNAKTGMLVCDAAVRPVLEKAIEEQKDQYTEGDLRAIIKDMLETTNQIKSRDAVWFVPESSRAALQKLLTFMDIVKLPYHKYELYDDPETVKQVTNDAEEDIKANLDQLKEAIAEVSVKGVGAKGALLKVKNLLAKCQFYKSALECKTEQIEEELKDSEATLTKVLRGKEEATPEGAEVIEENKAEVIEENKFEE